ncbi:MAG: coproporphyrinogen III oxidase [Actinomycetaceae bacterium]|nr:coproporphyrinogen III oxidase [Actinomycetaceae bacterium]
MCAVMSADATSAQAHGFVLPQTPPEIENFSAYIHIPFCRTRCGYCDFNTYTQLDFPNGASIGQYAATLAREIEMSASYLQGVSDAVAPRIDTVFFGGGTPTMLPASDIAAILEKLVENFELAPDAEITTEANPETVTHTYIEDLARAGITRISFGMQSAVPSVLATLDRAHTPGQVRKAVGWAHKAGLETSVDLIYGTPGETMADWEASVREALDLGVEHISAYALSLEPGVKMARQIRTGEIASINPDMQADFYERADEMLSAAGLQWYEISNWAGPGHECRHNMVYWRGGNWWGYGPGAHSHIDGIRFWNEKHPVKWAQALEAGEFPIDDGEVLSVAERSQEEIMLGIRLAGGIDAGAFPEALLDELAREGLIDVEGGRVRLTLRGRLLADIVTRRLWAL